MDEVSASDGPVYIIVIMEYFMYSIGILKRHILLLALFLSSTVFANIFEETVLRVTFENNKIGIKKHENTFVETEDISFINVQRMPNGNGVAAVFNGETSKIEFDVNEFKKLKIEGAFTYHIRLRFVDLTKERFLMGRYGVGYLVDMENWPHGIVSLNRGHFAGSSSGVYCKEGHFYDIFFRFKPKEGEVGKGKIFTSVFDSETGKKMGESPSWPTSYRKLNNSKVNFTIGFGQDFYPFKGEIEQFSVWDKYLSEDNLNYIVRGIQNSVSSKISIDPNLKNEIASNRWKKWIKSWDTYPICAWGYFHRYKGDIDEYSTYKDAGFNMVMAPLSTALVADSLDLKAVIGLWDDNGKYAILNKNSDKLQKYVDFAKKNLKDNAVYMLDDEPRTKEDISSFLAANEYIYKNDSSGLPMVDLLSYPFNIGAGFSQYLEGYIKDNHPAVLLTDNYALYNSHTDENRFYGNYEIVRKKALQADIGFMGFVQNTGHGPFRTASESDLYWQANSLIAYGAKGIWYYNYRISEKTFDEALVTGKEGKPTQNYYYAQKLNKQIQAIGATLMKLQTTGVYHLHSDPNEVYFLTRSYQKGAVRGIEEIRGDKLLIGEFRKIDCLQDEDNIYVIFLNKRHDALKETKDTSLQTDISIKVKNIYDVYEYSLNTGSPKLLIDINLDSIYNFSLDGGQIVFLELCKKTETYN